MQVSVADDQILFCAYICKELDKLSKIKFSVTIFLANVSPNQFLFTNINFQIGGIT